MNANAMHWFRIGDLAITLLALPVIVAGAAESARLALDELPGLRGASVVFSIDRNAVAWLRPELEIRGVLEIQKNARTFVGRKTSEHGETAHRRSLGQFIAGFAARAGVSAFNLSGLAAPLDDASEALGQRR